jgi:hypothetical protein
MRAIALFVLATLLSGCASHFTPRPPVIEDKVGLWGQEKVGTLSTAADYRVVYVLLDDKTKLCAEAPADAGAQFASAFSGGLTGPLGGTEKLSAQASANLAVAMKQLFKRSQGVQIYRDGVFALCNLYLNKAIDNAAYLQELQELRKAATSLIAAEIPHLKDISIDPTGVPQPPTLPSAKQDAAAPSAKADGAAPSDGKKP